MEAQEWSKEIQWNTEEWGNAEQGITEGAFQRIQKSCNALKLEKMYFQYLLFIDRTTQAV